MRSVFDTNRQNKKIESKIVAALERVSEAFRVLLWNEGKEHALSPIQIQLLIFLLFHPDEQCKVSYLALEFNMTKATISDSVKTLMQKGLAQKIIDPTDTRSYFIGLTDSGREVAQKSASFAGTIEKPLVALSDAQKEVILSGLLKLIVELNKAGVITIQRMCFSCMHYQHTRGKHYCNLLKSPLTPSELRIDCPEHDLA